jgi:hypothetical protein
MRTTQSGHFLDYWPVVLAVALIVMAALQGYGRNAAPREPLAADQVTAEFARAVSYGLIDTDSAQTPSAVRRAVAPGASAQASQT